MDINTITEVVRQPANQPGVHWRDGDAWLAGGTWLFSDEQPQLCRLIDLMPLGWTELTVSDDGLEIGAMCTIRDLYDVHRSCLLARSTLDRDQLRGVFWPPSRCGTPRRSVATSACHCPLAR